MAQKGGGGGGGGRSCLQVVAGIAGITLAALAGGAPPGRTASSAAGESAGSPAAGRAQLDRAALARPDPGRRTLHRLNRTEYANAVRDLLGVEIDVDALLPADDEQHGFDNNAEALSVSPTLIERYLAAAQRISLLAVGDLGLRPTARTYPVHGGLDQDGTVSNRRGFALAHACPPNSLLAMGVDLAAARVNEWDDEALEGLERAAAVFGFERGKGRAKA